MSGWVGVDPEYRNAANPLDRPLGDPSVAALRVLEHEQLCRRPQPVLDWRGNPVVQAPERRPEPQPEQSRSRRSKSQPVDSPADSEPPAE